MKKPRNFSFKTFFIFLMLFSILTYNLAIRDKKIHLLNDNLSRYDDSNSENHSLTLSQLPHDVNVSLSVPSNPELGNSYNIIVTAENIGENTESEVYLELYLNNTRIDFKTVINLPVGGKDTLTYNWKPTEYGEFTFFALGTLPGGIDDDPSNNMEEILIPLHAVNLFEGLYLNYTVTDREGDNGDVNISYSLISTNLFKADYKLNFSEVYEGSWDIDAQTRLTSNSDDGGPGDNVHTAYWIFNDTSLGDIVQLVVADEGDHTFEVTDDFFYQSSTFGILDVWVLEDLTTSGGVAWYEKSTGMLVYGKFYYDNGQQNYIYDISATNAPFKEVIFDHEIEVLLSLPSIIEVGKSYSIEATVRNIGQSDESDVELYLYINEKIVDSIQITLLAAGTNEILEYNWKPINYGSHNITAYAPPIAPETLIVNNRITKIKYLPHSYLFDGLYVKYIYETDDGKYNTTISYSRNSQGSFYETQTTTGFFPNTWIDDLFTRKMSGDSIYGDGNHTPSWIFTNTSLNDKIPMAVAKDGDHEFSTVNQIIYRLPQSNKFVKAWKLEDLNQTGGVAYYEKGTGLLLEANFISSEITSSYLFKESNAKFNYVAPGNFQLSSNAGKPDEDGNFTLTWGKAAGALNYTIYQYSNYINEINESLTILKNGTTSLEWEANNYVNGSYFFIIVACNEDGDCKSNCLQINVAIPLDSTQDSEDKDDDSEDKGFPMIFLTIMVVSCVGAGLIIAGGILYTKKRG